MFLSPRACICDLASIVLLSDSEDANDDTQKEKQRWSLLHLVYLSTCL